MEIMKPTRVYRHPRTRTRYRYPHDYKKYRVLVNRVDCSCTEGHFGCGAWEGGPCSDEWAAEYGHRKGTREI